MVVHSIQYFDVFDSNIKNKFLIKMLRFCLRSRDYIDQVFIATPAKNRWVTSRIFRYGLPEDFFSKVQKSYLSTGMLTCYVHTE